MMAFDSATVVDEKHDTTLHEHTPEKVSINDVEHGILPEQGLNPKPTSDPSDPLNWPLGLKIACLLQVSLLAALGGLNTAIINPSYVPMAKELHITTVQASYQTYVIPISYVCPI